MQKISNNGYGGGIQLLLKRLPDSSVSSLFNSFQYCPRYDVKLIRHLGCDVELILCLNCCRYRVSDHLLQLTPPLLHIIIFHLLWPHFTNSQLPLLLNDTGSLFFLSQYVTQIRFGSVLFDWKIF